jgi:hypothetical protein
MGAPKVSRFQKKVDEQVLSEDDLMFREAVRNLYPILSTGERYKYRELVDTPKTASMSKQAAEVRRSLDGSMEKPS